MLTEPTLWYQFGEVLLEAEKLFKSQLEMKWLQIEVQLQVENLINNFAGSIVIHFMNSVFKLNCN